MASNRIACIHITHDDVRILEGRIGGGVMMITNSTVVENAGRFFSGTRLAFLQELVLAIVNAMTVNSFTAKDLYVVYDNNLQVDFFLDERLFNTGEKGFRSVFQKKQDDEQKPASTGSIVHKSKWGKFITELDQGELTTTTHVERDLVNFMFAEFHEHGYKLRSFEAPETALIYFRNFAKYTYDALNKLVVYANNDDVGSFFQFTKDVPVSNKQFHFDMVRAMTLPDKLIGCIQEEIQKSKLHNPQIILAGDVFADPDVYLECCEEIKKAGLVCLDTYALWRDRGAPMNSLRVIVNDEGPEIERGGRFGLCVALMCRMLEKKPENMLEGIRISLLDKKQKQAIADVFLTIAILGAIYGTIRAGVSIAEIKAIEPEYSSLSVSVESQLSGAEAARDRLRTEYLTLASLDTRLNEIIRFVYSNQDENINVVSIDSFDMLPAANGVVTTTTNATESQQMETSGQQENAEANALANNSMNTIVLRGYAKTPEAPMEFYKKMSTYGFGSLELVGVEQVFLPTSEELYTFELLIHKT